MELNEARQKLDALDRELLDLFKKRMEIIAQLAEYKRVNHLDIFDPAREAFKLRDAAEYGGERFGECTRCLMEDILAISRDYQVEHLRRIRAAASGRKS